MYRIFQFLYRYRSFLLFVAIELLCGWMIVTYNQYQGTAFFNTSNYYAGELLSMRNGVVSYFHLQKVNTQLAHQNALLLDSLMALKANKEYKNDTCSDFLRLNQFEFISARVVKNTTRYPENFITLDKGTLDGVERDMGVIGPDGLVGKVKTVSKHFSTVISMLHSGMNIASKIKGKNIDATVVWDGIDPTEGKVLHVIRHHKISKGDTLITSEYNAIFPKGVMIGTIKDFELHRGSSDYDINLNFSSDFTSLSYVYVIKNKLRTERDSLETTLH